MSADPQDTKQALANAPIQSIRLAFAMVLFGASLLVACHWLGVFPDAIAIERAHRVRCSEMIALQSSAAIRDGRWTDLEEISRELVVQDPSLLSIRVQSDTGISRAHFEQQQDLQDRAISDPTRIDSVIVPITVDGQRWGQLEVCFAMPEHTPEYMTAWVSRKHALLPVLAVFCTAGLIGYSMILYLVRNTSRAAHVVPDRVRQALDTLAEGLLVLDERSEIVLANQAFADTIGVSTNSLVQRRAESLNWVCGHHDRPPESFPWTTAIEKAQTVTGTILRMSFVGQKTRIYSVNAAPIEGAGVVRGALVTLRDVTKIMEHGQQLEETLTMLSASRDQIEQKNRELEILATQDALTGCLNRRAFSERFGRLWQLSRQENRPLSCIMIDNDHFKRVNDTYGHAVGDEVLREVAQVLKARHSESGIVCRYGGEEFCVILPDVSLEVALELAEGTRKAIEQIVFSYPSELELTASLGVSETRFGATEPQELINQADTCLYAAKRRGRNCVVEFTPSLEQLELLDEGESGNQLDNSETVHGEGKISRSAVDALLASLAYRDPITAQHCRRVASLCGVLGEKMMEEGERQLLQYAALLHDIGKVAVPDHILLKRGRLSPDEIDLIRQHERLGNELIERTFQCPELTQILKCRRAEYNGFGRNTCLPSHKEIPLAARILAICDSYDSMTHDHVYREPRGHDEAVEELRKHAGTQFDPDLVEFFVEQVSNSPPTQNDSNLEISQHIGVQVQLLADAIREEDVEGVQMLASRLVLYARRCQADRIAESAGHMHSQSIDEEIAWASLLGDAQELSVLCREFASEPAVPEVSNLDSMSSCRSNASGDATNPTTAGSSPAVSGPRDRRESLMQGIPVPTERDNSSYSRVER